MDKTSYTIGLTLSVKVVVFKGKKQAFKTVDDLYKWVNQINYIGIGGKTISLYIIFKGK